ncbi:MAG: hypothetical protein Alpg2KO_09980 [Alphaproteobacteria bacterium]
MSENAEQEPSMEEILASIRKIISDDDEEAQEEPAAEAAPEPAPEPTPEPAPAAEPEEEDVLELTEVIEEAPEPEPEPEVVAEPEPAFDAPEIREVDLGEPPAPEPEPEPVEVPDEALVSAPAAAAAAGAFSALASNSTDKVGDNTIIGADTLAGLTQELLRPMLKDWLDQHLPPLVERLVKQEIERLSRGS